MKQNLLYQILEKKENGEEYIRVSFERPAEKGFDTIVFELPSYKIIEKDGFYTDEEIELFKTIVERGAAYFYEISKEGNNN